MFLTIGTLFYLIRVGVFNATFNNISFYRGSEFYW
jgi:hypothetical protein